MPDSNEFYNRLINKNNDELDSLLSYADGIKKETKKSLQSADSILDELMNPPGKKADSSYQVISAEPVSKHAAARNFHHIGSAFKMPEYISYSSICSFSREKSAPIITDEAESQDTDSQPNDIPESFTEKSVPYSEEKNDKSNINDKNTEADSRGLSGAEKFISAQEKKHPRLYFIIGFSIFLIAVLGLVSCIYLGLTTLKKL